MRESPDKSQPNWIWGEHAVAACIENFPELILELFVDEKSSTVFKSAQNAGIKIKDAALPKLLADKRTQGTAARIKYFPTTHFQDYKDEWVEKIAGAPAKQWALLDGVQDPRNYGAILRSAAAFGIQAVIVGERHQCPPTGVVAQASAGNLFRLKIVVAPNLSNALLFANEQGLLSLALDAHGESIENVFPVQTAKTSVLWVLGSEGPGLRKGLSEKCSRTVSIPMSEGVESLNVSAASTLAFYAFARR